MESQFELTYIPVDLQNIEIAFNIQKIYGHLIQITKTYMIKRLIEQRIIVHF